MSINSDHRQFQMATSTKVLSAADFEVPETPSDGSKVQELDLQVGDEFAIYTAAKTAYATYKVARWQNVFAGEAKKVELLDTRFQTPMYLTSWQMAWLSKRGRLRPVHIQKRHHHDAILPGSALALTPEQHKRAHELIEYIDAYQLMCETENFGKPSNKIMKRAIAEVSKKKGCEPVSPATLYRAISQLKGARNVDRLYAVAPKLNKGNTMKRKSDKLQDALNKAVTAAWSDPAGTWKTAKAVLNDLVSSDPDFMECAKEAKSVSDRLIQYRLHEVDHYSRSYLRYGQDYADRIMARSVRLERPQHPLEVVDVDHTTLDVVVFDDQRPISFGRPDIIVFRDRHSGCVIGFHVGFEAPAYESFVAGLAHTTFPKDPAVLPGNVTFPWYGLPWRIGVDNASHFVGNSIENAAREIGFQVVEYRPGRPWEKGATEHLFSVMNRGLVHRLPGSTTLSPDERKKHDADAKKAEPVLTLNELNGFLYYYFAEVYNRGQHAGVGKFLTLTDCPARIWDEGISKVPMRPPMDIEVFSRLVGVTEQVTIQSDGIRLQHLFYQSAELIALTSNPNHVSGRTGKDTTKYTVTRDPNNLAVIWVRDPYRKVVIEVPIIGIQKSYAQSVNRYQHTKVVEYYRRSHKIDDKSIVDFTRARDKLEVELAAFHAKRNKHGTALQLARFVASQGNKIRRSKTVEIEPDYSVDDHLDYGAETADATVMEMSPETAPQKSGVKAAQPDPKPRKQNHTTKAIVEAQDDITETDDLRSQLSEWDD